MVVESRSVIRKAKNARGLGRDRAVSPIFPAATAPFPKSCASYFHLVRFNTFPLYYLRAWHRLVLRLSLFLCFPGLQHFVIEPPEPYGLPLNFKTLPETLRDAGKKRFNFIMCTLPI